MTEKDVSPQELLTGYRADTVARAEALRVLVKQAAPGASEMVYVGWRAITYASFAASCRTRAT